MSGRERQTSRPRRLYRDRERGVILGVCAGLAEFFDLQVMMVRLITLLSFLIFSMPTLIIYVILGMLLKDKPLSYYGPDDDWYFRERKFWRRNVRR